MNGQEPWAEMRRQMEKLFGYPKGAFDPASNILRDMERVNKALEEGFAQFRPQALEARLKALHPDMPIQKVNEVVGKVVKILQPNLDGLWRRRQ